MTHKLTQREKLLSFVVGGAVLLIVNLLLIQYFIGTLNQQQRDTVRKQGELKAMQNLLRDTAKWEKLDVELRTRQPKVENEARAGSDLLTQVQELAKKSSVLVEQPVIGNPDRKPEYTAVVVNIETKSTWKSLIQFVHSLQGPDQFIVVENAELKIDNTDQTQMRGKFRIAKWYAPKS
jgi:Type II secretion system (T2SS), protein M subtype b